MVLKQIERFEDEAASYPGVTGVQSVALAMRLVNMALSGEPRAPPFQANGRIPSPLLQAPPMRPSSCWWIRNGNTRLLL